jgi:hypothetical protein
MEPLYLLPLYIFSKRSQSLVSPVSQKFKEIGSNLDKPLEFMITFKEPGKVVKKGNVVIFYQGENKK